MFLINLQFAISNELSMLKLSKLKIFSSLAFFIAILGLAENSLAASWYIDNTASGANNGTSWENAWQGFAAVNYSAVSCGDTIYISGGAEGSAQSYSERLAVGNKICTQNSPLKITVGTDAAHKGTVKITGTPGLGDALRVSNSSWITIDGQSGSDGQPHIEITQTPPCTNCAVTGVSIDGTTAVGNAVKFVHVHDTGNPVSQHDTGIKISAHNLTGVEISYNTIESVVDCITIGDADGLKPNQYGLNKIHHNTMSCLSDGISGNASVDFYGNDVRVAPQDYTGTGHPDGMQIFGSYWRIYNNYFHDFLSRTRGGNSILYWEPDGGENMDVNEHVPCCMIIYNNLFYDESQLGQLANGAVMIALSDSRFTGAHDFYFLNNTLTGSWTNALSFAWGGTNLNKNEVNNFFVENNLFWNAAKSGNSSWNIDTPTLHDGGIRADLGSHASGASIVIDYNLYSGVGAATVSKDGGYYSYVNFKSTFGTQNSWDSASDPDLNGNHEPQSNNLEHGYDWSSLFTADKRGVSRPQGAAWGIGAYEYVGPGGDSTSPVAPQGLLVW